MPTANALIAMPAECGRAATRDCARVATSHVSVLGVSRRWLFFPHRDEQSSNLMIIENWH